MNAPMDDLRSGLAHLADDVHPVDLRDRALRTSRRIGLRRTALTSALSLVLLGSAGVTAVALTGGGSGEVGPGASATATVAAPSPSAPSAQPTVTGDYYFLREAGATKLELHVLHESYDCGTPAPGTCVPDTRTEKLRTISIQAGDACPANSVTVSPDGRQVAWIVGADDPGNTSGDLMIADVRGGTPQKRGTRVLCAGTRALGWTPDSTRLYVGKRDNAATVGAVDAATGRFTAMERDAWTEAETLATGQFRGSVQGGRLTVTKADGTAPRSVAYEDEHGMDVVVLGVSYDGRFATVSSGAGDPSRQLDVGAVVDMTTGRPVVFPVGKVARVWFQPDGSLALGVAGDPGRLYRLNADGQVVAEIPVDRAVFKKELPFQVAFG
ncbi:hypothetical protein [Catellatospora vulcania]|uniref:hypothetical protein n=1 Tax=Catellatospora vulcania TaxID=1460450 RepID=UPI0012D42571|nr:hypothetical protein [Catellatospora vulcania]